MKIQSIENRLARPSLVLLALAAGYGIAAGAVVTMYYDVVPGMGAIDDRLGSVQIALYVLAAGSGLIHLPRALEELSNKSWRKAFVQAFLSFAPLFVFLGTDGLVAHFLWWGPLSDTDRYHILHHSLFAGVPLTTLYGLALRRFWKPSGEPATPVGRGFVVAGTIFAILLSLGVGILFGSPPSGLVLIAGLLASVVFTGRAKVKASQ